MTDDVNQTSASTKSDPITFGSCITISLSSFNTSFITSEGFMNSLLYIKKFEEKSPSHNFAFSVFRILPFSGISNFKAQTEFFDLIENFNERAQELSSKELKERKQKIQDLRTNLDSEMNMNTAIYNKLKGTPVLFSTSVFQLVHVATMKYLSLDDTNKDNLLFGLVDYPNDKSFFRFNPSLRLQKQRNNFVYNQDLVIISSTKQILNRFPSIYTNYTESTHQAFTHLNLGEELKESPKNHKVISATLEESKKWKLNLYQFQTNDDQDANNFLKIGDAVWLNLSERNYYLTASLTRDPFEKQIMGLNKLEQKTSQINPIKSLNSSQLLGDPETNSERDSATSVDNSIDSHTSDFYEDEINENLELNFEETTVKRTGKSTEYVEMATNGLWKIEPQNSFEGGYLRWENPYRFRHLTSGRYLKIEKRPQESSVITLSMEGNNDSLFYLVPIENLLKDDPNKKYISKDSYFRLQTKDTKEYICLQRIEGEERIRSGANPEQTSSEVPGLTNKVREIDIFKIAKADYEEVWETSFLLSSLPILLALLKQFKPGKERIFEELRKQKKFEEKSERALTSLNYLLDFAYNKLPGNIALSQEFALVSAMRQRILREQNILGVICWLLIEGFPDDKDLQKVDWKLIEFVQEKHGLKHRTAAANQQLQAIYNAQEVSGKRRLEKVEKDSIARRYKLCYFLYSLLKTMCLRNPENQEYVFKFVGHLMYHLSYGRFVSECLQIIFSDNEKILYSLHKNLANAPNQIPGVSTEPQDRQRIYINEIVNKLKSSKSYEQSEILNLLNQICSIKDQAIYINQDKIFKLIYEDKSFRSNYLINMNIKQGVLYVEFKSVEMPLESFFKKGETIKHLEEMAFLKSQLELFASLSMDRNSSSGKQLSKVFTLDALMNYMFNTEIPEEFRAKFIRLLSSIHIDKEPRMVQEKPNLVRIVDIKKLAPISPAAQAQVNESPKIKAKKKKLKKKISIVMTIKSPTEIESGKSLIPTIKTEEEEEEGSDDSAEEDTGDEKMLLSILKIRLLQFLADKAAQLEDAREKKIKVDIFNNYTLEILRLVGKMIRFGLFTTQKVKSETETNSLFGGLISQFKKDEKKSVGADSEIERLIKYLTPMLEYDESYFESMRNAGIKRKNYGVQSQNLLKKGMKGMIGGVTDFGKTLMSFGNILGVGEAKEEKKGRIKTISLNSELENEGIKDQIFKKPESLKKILLKFSNKTYTIKEDDNENNLETQTKKIICEILDYIMDIRKDFLLENTIQYFKSTILAKDQTSIEEHQKNVKKDVETLFPEKFLEVGQTSSNEKKLKNYTYFEEIRSFDEVLEKPFIESLLLGFFLTNSAIVQNSILELVHRCCNEKKDFLDSIEKVELLFSQENRKLYATMDKLLNGLKVLFANSQTWLQVTDKNVLADSLVHKTYKKLIRLKNLFEENKDDADQLKIKQRIFRHMGGNKIIIQPLEKGLTLCDTLVERYKEFSTPEQRQKFKNVTSTIVDIFKVIHSIMGLFCLKNTANQKMAYKRINFIAFQKSMNIGQIELLIEVFQYDPKNSSSSKGLSEHLIRYLTSMIRIHGRKEIFLKVFKTITDQQTEDLIETEKRILIVLLEDQVLQVINPFSEFEGTPESPEISGFEADASPLFYTSLLLQIMAKCLKNDIGINLISKTYKALPMRRLTELLFSISDQEVSILTSNKEVDIGLKSSMRDSSSLLECIEKAKQAIIDLILIFIQHSKKAMDELSGCHRVIIEVIELETRRILLPNAVTSAHVSYILGQFVPLVNIYHENFLKDSTMMFDLDQGSQGMRDFKSKQIILNFAKKLLDRIDAYIPPNEVENGFVKFILQMVANFKLQAPEHLKMIDANNEKNQQDQNELDEENDQDTKKKKSSRGSKVGSIMTPSGDPIEDDFFEKPEKGLFKGLKKRFERSRKSVKGIFTKSDKSVNDTLALDFPDGVIGTDANQKKLWTMFKDAISFTQIQEEIKGNISVLSKSIMNISQMYAENDDQNANSELKDLLITSDDILIKFLSFIEFWIQKKAGKNTVIFLIRALGKIMKNTADEKEMVSRQDMFDRLNATKIITVLIWNEKEDDNEYLYSLIKFGIKLLQGGNQTVQSTLYEFFRENSASEKFFRKINNLLQREITASSSSKGSSLSKQESKMLMRLLRFLQLFCEGHNLDLQNYLRHQTHSKNNYDLVVMTIKVLVSLKVNKKNHDTVMQCFDTLTEFIQGPCKANQSDLVNSKLLEYAVGLLAEEGRVIEYYGVRSDRKSTSYGGKSSSYGGNTILNQSKAESSSKDGASTIVARRRGAGEKKTDANSQFDSKSRLITFSSGRKKMKIEPAQLAQVKYKCLITLVSLLELNDESSDLLVKIRRAVPVSIVAKNLAQVYEQYKRKYKDTEYDLEMFGNAEKEDEEFIIENGFNIYTLLNLLLANRNDILNDEDEEINAILNNEKKEVKGLAGLFKDSVFGEVTSFGTGLLKGGLGAFKQIKKKMEETLGKENEEFNALQHEVEEKEMIREAINFFKSKMACIEIVRDGKLEKIYFPVLPFCFCLPKKVKKDFHESVNRASTKTKVADLMKNAPDIIRLMQREENLTKKFNKYKLVGFISNRQRLWEFGAFYTNLFLNVIIISSYSSKYSDRLKDPHLFMIDSFNGTLSIIKGVGTANIVLSSLVVFLFFLRRAPLLYEPIWEGFSNIPWGFNKVVKMIVNIIMTVISWLTDFDFAYYAAYIIFALLGLIIHPFFFVFHLSDLLRIELLKNVVKAVWKPRIPLLLTMLFFVLVEYYFTLIGYSVYNDNYKSGSCDDLWKCFFTTFDQTFKNNGGVGAYLVDPNSLDSNGDPIPGYLNVGRFFFDMAFNAVLLIIMMNMVAGIIIDTFGALKDQLSEKQRDITQNCFICGFDRERLDKSSLNQKGFELHIKQDHNLWNYVFYRAFLESKERTEYNGNESYVKQKIDDFDLGWLPVKRTAAVKDEVEESNEKIESMRRIINNMGHLKTLLATGTSKVSRALDISSRV